MQLFGIRNLIIGARPKLFATGYQQPFIKIQGVKAQVLKPENMWTV